MDMSYTVTNPIRFPAKASGFSPNCPEPSGAQPVSYSLGTRVHGQGVKLSVNLQLVTRLSVNVAVPPLANMCGVHRESGAF